MNIEQLNCTAKVNSNNGNGDRAAYTNDHLYKLGLVTGQHVDIIAIYRRHRRYRSFPGPTATRGCSCWRLRSF